MIDKTPPEITFKNGDDTVWINYGDTFDISLDNAITVTDNSTVWSGNGIPADQLTITTTVNPEHLPTTPFTDSQSIIYTATDKAGNIATKTRTIRVNQAPKIA